jgi:hypothetical protein
MEINKNKTIGKILFTILLESEVKPMGLLYPVESTPLNYEILSNEGESISADGEELYYITGLTNSKLSYIVKSFPLNKVELNTPITIRGTAIQGIIRTPIDSAVVEYELFLTGTSVIGITYFDYSGGTTSFKFHPNVEIEYSERIFFLLHYLTLIDEPKLDSNVFIDRGVNNVFESFKRLKTVANIEELGRTGFGYFNVVSSS